MQFTDRIVKEVTDLDKINAVTQNMKYGSQ